MLEFEFFSQTQTIHMDKDLFTEGWLLKHILLLIILTLLVVKVGPSTNHKTFATFTVLLIILKICSLW